MWKAPIRPNGILKEYELKLKAEGSIITRFTESTNLFYDTKINSSDSIEFKVQPFHLSPFCLFGIMTVNVRLQMIQFLGCCSEGYGYESKGDP